MFSVRFLLPLSLLCCSTLSSAEETIVLQSKQISALAITTQQLSSADTAHSSPLAAHVLVPNAQMRIIAAPLGGMVERLAVAVGSSVKRGQVLAYLASPQALELQRDALQATSQAQLQQKNLQRDEQLFAEGLIAESRLQTTRAAARQASAQASERRQGLAMAGLTAGQLGGPLALTAPIDGVVLEQGVQLGQRIEAATLIYRIAKLSPLWLEIQVPRELASGLKHGMPVKVAQTPISGQLISIGRAVDPASQSILLRASVINGAENLSPGQVVEVEIGSDSAAETAHSKQFSLPASALIRQQDKTLVFVQTNSNGKESRFVSRPVRVISQGGDHVVVDGLNKDESVVVKGVSTLKSMLTAQTPAQTAVAGEK
jgi:RND family efflux transporter MFP subunit